MPLLEEVVRKYMIYSDFVFLGGDLFAILTLLAIVVTNRAVLLKIPRIFWIGLTLFIFLTLPVHLSAGHPIAWYGIGLRATLLPLIYLAIAANFVSRNSRGHFLIFCCATAWICIVAVVAVVQVYLGKNHPINAVWGQTALGYGDYSSGLRNVDLQGLFRPVAIFTHTGKFGQAIFALILYRWCFIATSGTRIPIWCILAIPFDLMAILASGQRSAMLFLILSMIFVLAIFHKRSLLRWFPILLIMLASFYALITRWLPEIGDVVFARFISTFSAIPERLQGNFLLPMTTLTRDYLFSGEGFGRFTFGSQVFGGTQVYRHIEMEGLGESSLIRLFGEVGIVPAVVLIAAFLTLLFRAYREAMKNKLSTNGASSLFYFLWIFCLCAWANTADVFANSIVMTLGCAFGGGVLATRSSRSVGGRAT